MLHFVSDVVGLRGRQRLALFVAAAAGLRTRRTGTSVAVLRLDGTNGEAPDGERRPANLEDVFVLLTGEEIT